jgi:hypothetical protein
VFKLANDGDRDVVAERFAISRATASSPSRATSM